MGGARSLSREVCQGIRVVLAEGTSASLTLSQRAKAALKFLQDDMSISSGSHFITSRPEEAIVRTWTFAGTRANRTFARNATGAGSKVKFDALSVQAPASLLESAPGTWITLTDDELAVFAETIKFSACLPRNLLAETVTARAFEVAKKSA